MTKIILVNSREDERKHKTLGLLSYDDNNSYKLEPMLDDKYLQRMPGTTRHADGPTHDLNPQKFYHSSVGLPDDRVQLNLQVATPFSAAETEI